MSTTKNTNRPDFMIDTVSLKIKHTEFRVLEPEMFYPELVVFTKKTAPFNWKPSQVFKKYIQNATKEDKFADCYKPLLTAYRRMGLDDFEYELHIEFSVPKLLYGENLSELSDSDFPQVIKILKEKLLTMGIDTTESVLRKSVVTKAHFGKNISLPYPMTVRDVLNELKKADLGKRMEVNTREYRNDGESLYFYTSVHNIIFYDKVKDIEKTKNISVDKNKTDKERALIKERDMFREQVLRMEVRYNGLRTVASVVSKLLPEKPEYVSFELIFNRQLCKDALIRNWRDITDRPSNQLAFKMTLSPEDVLNILMARARSSKTSVHSLNKVLINFGLHQLINQLGAKTVKNKFLTTWSEKTCITRLDEKVQSSAVMLQDVPPCEVIGLIDKKLNEFKNYGKNGDI